MNKKAYIFIIILVILLLSQSFMAIIYINNFAPNSISYNVGNRIWLFKYNCGIPLQVSASVIGYLGITLSSVFDEDIKNDMNSIDWNIFNTNELPVFNAKKVSFYKGVPIFKFNYNRSGSFLAIFMTRGRESSTTLRHEFGHNIQQLILGPINYLLCVGLPSWQEWSNRYYYDRPWEITADILGGVTTRKHKNVDIQRGYSFLDISAMFGIFSYSFLKGEFEI